MHIPKYWARSDSRPANFDGRPAAIACWRWSDLSIEDARQQADTRAAELAAVQQKGPPDRYAYGDRPMREEIIQTFGGENSAIITRNLYGALVLNASSAMFIDVDFPEGAGGATTGGLIGKLFGKAPAGPQEQSLARIRTWAAGRPDLGVRIYRTFAGLRCLITNQIFDPTADASLSILNAAGGDPLYVRLCQAQSCFRARLTPKPWRFGMHTPPSRYPWTSSQDESRYRQWQAEYDRSIQKFSVCRLIEQIGQRAVHPAVAPIIALHDKYTCAADERQLA